MANKKAQSKKQGRANDEEVRIAGVVEEGVVVIVADGKENGPQTGAGKRTKDNAKETPDANQKFDGKDLDEDDDDDKDTLDSAEADEDDEEDEEEEEPDSGDAG